MVYIIFKEENKNHLCGITLWHEHFISQKLDKVL